MRRSTLLDIGAKPDSTLDIDALAGKMGVSLGAQTKTLAEASHGEIITLEDGTRGLVIDTQEEMNQKFRDEKMDQMAQLANPNDPLFDCISIKTEQTVDARKAMALSARLHNDSFGYGALLQLQHEFGKYTFGPQGLVPIDDPRAEDYIKKIEAVRSGKVRLPTVAEFEAQQKELHEEMKRGITMDVNNQVQPITQNQQPATPPAPIQQEPVPTSPQHRQIDPNAQISKVQPLPTPTPVAAPDPIQTPVQPAPAPVTEAPAPEPQQPQKPEAANKVQPINLARAMAQQNGAAQQPQPVEEQPPVENQSPTISIDVPADEAATLIDNLPSELREKVDAASVLKVNAVVMKDVPVATRRIDSITQFKSIFPKKVVGELVEKVLINSGYIATVDGASSLDMATIAYDPNSEIPDWPKRIQFAYDHLVHTSIGDLTFSKFVQETSAQDIDTLIAAIYQASEPDVKKLMVQCGNPKCRDTHEISFSVSNMWDTSEFDEDTINYFNEIISARDNIFQAREVHSRAPVMQVDYLKFDNMYFAVKHTDADSAGRYFPVAQELANVYNPSVTIYVAFIKEVIISEDEQTFSSNSPEVICQALLNISNDDDQAALRNYILNNMKEYKNYEFKMKPLKAGEAFVCKKCGHVDESIDIRPDTLVFQKASVAGRF